MSEKGRRINHLGSWSALSPLHRIFVRGLDQLLDDDASLTLQLAHFAVTQLAQAFESLKRLPRQCKGDRLALSLAGGHREIGGSPLGCPCGQPNRFEVAPGSGARATRQAHFGPTARTPARR